MNSKIRRYAALLFLIVLGGLIFAARRQGAGFGHYHRFQRLRAEAASIQSGFASLETELGRAIQAWPHPLFYRELGLLYFDRAVAEDKFGGPDLRDAFLVKAAAAMGESLRRNPADARVHFNLGKIWVLYNRPLLTYAEKARSYLRTALDLYPAGDSFNLNGLYLFLIQWDSLASEEKRFVLLRIEHKFEEKAAFIGLLKDKWVSSGGDPGTLKAILMTEERIWKRISGEFGS